MPASQVEGVPGAPALSRKGHGQGHGGTGAAGRAHAEQEWPDHGLTSRQVVVTMAGVMLAMFMAALDQTIVSTAMPRIIGDLGGFDRYTWVTTAYLVSSTSIVLLVGRLGDLYGRKWLYIAGISGFLAGSVLSALAQSMNVLIAARAFQGIGGGVMMALSFVVIADLFPPAERGKYQGLTSATFGVSSVLGPLIGGFLTDNLSWHWIFWVNIPIGIPVIFLFLRMFPAARTPGTRAAIDIPGAFLIIVGMVSFLLGLSWAGASRGHIPPQAIVALALGLVCVVAFVFYELRAREPLMPIKLLFSDRTTATMLVAGFLVGVGMFGTIIFVPLFFQGVKGLSATHSGSITTPMSLSTVFGSILAGQALSRLGGHYKIQGLIGLGIMVAGMSVLALINEHTSWGVAMGAAMLVGFGMGNTFPVFTIAVQNAVPWQYLGAATSAGQFFRQVGGSVGLAVFGSLMVVQFAGDFTDRVPAQAVDALTPARVEAMSHQPNALVSEEGQADLRASLAPLGDQAGPVYGQTVDALKSSLADAIGFVFKVALVLIAVAWITVWFSKEIPLKRRGRRGPAPASGPSQSPAPGQSPPEM